MRTTLMGQIENIISDINNMSSEISKGTNEQNTISNDASQSIVKISDMLKGATENLNEAMSVTYNLNSLAVTLKEVVNKFRFKIIHNSK